MPKFAKLTPRVEPPLGDAASPRKALAQAIRERDAAIKAVDDARTAEHRARLESYEANAAARKLRAEEGEAESHDDALIRAIESGDADDILALGRPVDEARAKIEATEQRAATWKAAADRAEEAIEVRERALAKAEEAVTQAARVAFLAEIDVDALIDEARTAAAWIVGRRSLFLFLMTVLQDGPARDSLAHFMSRPWLIGELDESWKRDPAIAPFREAFEALKRDANAEVDLSAP
jgi:hypothetical protein